MARASLPMYDLPEVAKATEAWWRGLARAFARAGLEGVPAALSRRPVAEDWRAGDLLFSQTCGYPLLHAYSRHLRLVATPCYGAPGCEGALYRSLLVVREEETAARLSGLTGRRVAVNAIDSQSGYNVLRAMVAPLAAGGRFFAKVGVTGSHRDSLRAVRRGLADLCAVDCVIHGLLAHHDPSAIDGLRVLEASPAAPGLPYVTAAAPGPEASDQRIARLRDGLAAAFTAPDLASAREALLLAGHEPLALADYEVIREMERRAKALGYPHLA